MYRGMRHALGQMVNGASAGQVKGATQDKQAGMEGGSLFKISALQ